MARSIFRETSLERLSSPEQIDRLLAVGNIKYWLIITATLLVIINVILWAFFGELPEYVEGNGMLLQGEGLSFIYSGFNGLMEHSYLWELGNIEKGNVIAILQNEETGTTTEIKTLHSGRVMEIFAFPGDYVSAGQIIASVENEKARLSAVLYIPMSQGKKIKHRAQVNLKLSSVNTEVYGYLEGWVKTSSFYPVSQQNVTKTLGNAELAEKICNGVPVIKVAVELLRDIKNEEDFVWTSHKKFPYELSGGTECSGVVLIGTFRPIDLLFNKK